MLCCLCDCDIELHGYKITAFDNESNERDTEYYCSSSCIINAYGRFYTRWELIKKAFK